MLPDAENAGADLKRQKCGNLPKNADIFKNNPYLHVLSIFIALFSLFTLFAVILVSQRFKNIEISQFLFFFIRPKMRILARFANFEADRRSKMRSKMRKCGASGNTAW